MMAGLVQLKRSNASNLQLDITAGFSTPTIFTTSKIKEISSAMSEKRASNRERLRALFSSRGKSPSKGDGKQTIASGSTAGYANKSKWPKTVDESGQMTTPTRSDILPTASIDDANSLKADDVKPTALPRGCLPSPEQLWDQAYDAVQDDDPELIRLYESILDVELGESEDGDGAEKIVSQQGQNARKAQMHSLLQAGLNKTKKLAGVEKKVAVAINVVLSVKSALDSALTAVPIAAIAWTSVCVALQVSPGIHTCQRPNTELGLT